MRFVNDRVFERQYKKLPRAMREKVVERLVERSRKNFDELLDHMPGLKKVSGRERLAFYRSKDEAWLMQLATSYPDVARSVLRDFLLQPC